MRKLWCAGALAGGILLFGAAPAQADTLPDPGAAQEQPSPLRDALAQTNNWRFATPLASDPLSGAPLIDLSHDDRQLLRLQPGDDTGLHAVLRPASSAGKAGSAKAGSGKAGSGAAGQGGSGAAGQGGSGAVGHGGSGVAGQAGSVAPGPAGDRPLEAAPRAGRALPAADVVRGTLPGGTAQGGRVPAGAAAFSALPIDNLVRHAAPALAALGPDGLPVARGNHIAGPGRHPVTVRAESTEEPAGLPVVGGLNGLGGTLNGAQRQLNVSGLPLGGSPVLVNPERSGSHPSSPASPAGVRPGASTPPVGAASPAAVPSAAVPSAAAPSGTAPSGAGAPSAVRPGAVPSGAVPSGAVPSAAGDSGGSGGADLPGVARAPRTADQPVEPAGSSGSSRSAGHDAGDTPAAAKLAKTRAADPRLFEEPTEGLPGAGTE